MSEYRPEGGERDNSQCKGPEVGTFPNMCEAREEVSCQEGHKQMGITQEVESEKPQSFCRDLSSYSKFDRSCRVFGAEE